MDYWPHVFKAAAEGYGHEKRVIPAPAPWRATWLRAAYRSPNDGLVHFAGPGADEATVLVLVLVLDFREPMLISRN